MFAKYASLLTEKLNKQMNFSDEEKEIYEYGFELLLSIVVTMAIVISISLIAGSAFYSISFFLFFFVPRLFIGGLHASSHLKCTIMTVATFIFTIIASGLLFCNRLKLITVLLSAASLFIICLFSPVINPNHPISENCYKKNRKISIILSFLCLFTVCYLIFKTQYIEIGIHSGVSFIAVSVLLIIEKFRKGESQQWKKSARLFQHL